MALDRIRPGFKSLSRNCLVLFFIFAAELYAQTFQSQGVNLLGRVPLSAFPPGASVRANDCWGYVSQTGREYGIIGLQTGTAFVEVTNPTNPLFLQYIAAPGVNVPWRDMKTIGNYAYVVSDQSGFGLQIINLTNIDQGTVTLTSTHLLGGGFAIAHNVAANSTSKYLYLCLSSISGGITAVNVNSPTNPVIAGTWPPSGISTRVHDAQVVTYTSGPYAGKEIAFCFSEGQGLKIVDVTNKAQMFLRATVLYPGVKYCHQGWLTKDRKHIIMGDEQDESVTRPTTTYVVNVENLDSPFYVTSFTNGSKAIDHNLMIRDNLVYEANYTSGLRVYDITDVDCAREIAWLDTFPPDNAQNFNGAWGVYSALPSGNILVSDRDYGLFIARVDCNENGFDDDDDITAGLSMDLNNNKIPDECDGYVDCDNNGIGDLCESDCDNDGLTDACEPDCQINGTPDDCDIQSGTEFDCNANHVPDSCDLAQLFSGDCNGNSKPDECDVLTDIMIASPTLAPFGGSLPVAPQSFTLIAPTPAVRDVTLFFTAFGDYDLVQEYATIDLNGIVVGNIFEGVYPTCSGMPPMHETLVVPRDTFNAVLGGDVVIGMNATDFVSTQPICGTGHIQVTIEYSTLDPALDCNGNQKPDTCETGDMDGDGSATVFDYPFVNACVTAPCGQPPCMLSDMGVPCCTLTDFDHDGDVDLRDLAEWERLVSTP